MDRFRSNLSTGTAPRWGDLATRLYLADLGGTIFRGARSGSLAWGQHCSTDRGTDTGRWYG